MWPQPGNRTPRQPRWARPVWPAHPGGGPCLKGVAPRFTASSAFLRQMAGYSAWPCRCCGGEGGVGRCIKTARNAKGAQQCGSLPQCSWRPDAQPAMLPKRCLRSPAPPAAPCLRQLEGGPQQLPVLAECDGAGLTVQQAADGVVQAVRLQGQEQGRAGQQREDGHSGRYVYKMSVHGPAGTARSCMVPL